MLRLGARCLFGGVRQRRTKNKLKVKVIPLPLLLVFRSVPYFSPFIAELEGKVADAVSVAAALQKCLDVEVAERSALEVVVASACEGLGVEAGPSGSSLRGRVEALYSQAGVRLREALHAGVKKALAIVSSHYVGIDLPAVREGYVLPNDKVEDQEEVQKVSDAAEDPRDSLATFFDAEVELPLGA